MNINLSHISKLADGGAIVFVCDEPANTLPVSDIVTSLSLLTRKGAPVIIAGNDPVNQPAALAELVRSLKSSGIEKVCLLTHYSMTTLASPLSGVWPYIQEILERVDHLNAGQETVDVVALRTAQGGQGTGMSDRLIDTIGQFTTIPNSIIRMIPDIGEHAFMLFFYLRYRSNDQGQAFPSYTLIQTETTLTRQQISDAINTLVTAGLLECKRRFSSSTVYTLKMPEINRPAEPQPQPAPVKRPAKSPPLVSMVD